MRKSKINLIREAAQTGGAVMISRADVDGDTTAMGKAIPKGVGSLDVIGKTPIWERMGVDFNPNAKGTYILPYESPRVAEKLAELASVTRDTVTPNGILMAPARFPVQKVLTLETIASSSDEYISDLMKELTKACDRKITAEVYTKALAGATEIAGVTLTKAGFDLLQAGAEVENEGSFMAARGTFFEAKGVNIDAGSGRFLASMGEPDKGLVYDGTPIWYSSLFADGLTKKYLVYGDISKVHVADWGMTEIIVDKVTLASTGKVVFTVNKIANVALKNPNAFAKSPDLDAA